MDGQTKRQASKSARRQMDELGPFILCQDGTMCSDHWCVRLGCALDRANTTQTPVGDGGYGQSTKEPE